jgi:hypothetical protein
MSDESCNRRESAPVPPPADPGADRRPLSSATSAWVEHLVDEFQCLLGDRVSASLAAECDSRTARLYREALAEVSRMLPDLRGLVRETWDARSQLFEAKRRGGDVAESWQRLKRAITSLFAHRAVFEGEEPAPPGQANALTLSELLDLLRADHLPKEVPSNEMPDNQPPGDGGTHEQPTFVATQADLTILAVLDKAKRALKQHEIRTEASKLRKGLDRKPWMVPVSLTVIGERLPLLRKHGYVAPPLNRGGKPARRKGDGITEAGRDLLRQAATPP